MLMLLTELESYVLFLNGQSIQVLNVANALVLQNVFYLSRFRV